MLAAIAFTLNGLNAQAGVTREGEEYNIAAPLPGDQLHADLALGPNGGYLVWDDNVGDGDGLSVNVRRVNSLLSGELDHTLLSVRTASHQERPRVTLLSGGGAAFVWQSGPDGAQQVMTRTMNASGIFNGDEVAVSLRNDLSQLTPAIAALPNGNYVVVWSSYDQDGSMQGVYAALFDATMRKLTGEFQVNQFTPFNQRNPAVTALPTGGFVVTWISEGNRGESSADVFARIYDAAGVATGDEFRVNASDRVCSSPSIATSATGNFVIAWCEAAQDLNFVASSGNDSINISPINDQDGWDIYAAGFTSGGGRLTEVNRINQYTTGNQRNPSVAANGRTFMMVWSSFGQDGDWEGVIGRALSGSGAPDGDETIVNTGKIGRQLFPVVRGNGDSRFVVCWSTFTGLDTQVDLRAQRFLMGQELAELPAAAKPYVSALSQSRLSIAWPAADGYDVLNYEVYLNGSLTPTDFVTNQVYVVGKLAPETTYQVEVAYRLRDGQLSPRSPMATGKTWGEDLTDDDLPDDWQTQYWGSNSGLWPGPNADSDGDGVSNHQEFMAGTNPRDPNSVLRTSFATTPQGPRLVWNTVPGQVYQVEQTLDFSTWVPLGGLRFAPGTSDSISVSGGNSVGYYRVTRIR